VVSPYVDKESRIRNPHPKPLCYEEFAAFGEISVHGIGNFYLKNIASKQLRKRGMPRDFVFCCYAVGYNGLPFYGVLHTEKSETKGAKGAASEDVWR
jgi:hypothetical protein